MAILWGGRFQKSTDKKVDDFNSSIRFDKRMYKQDIKGSIAHATMLGRQNIIPKEDSDKIVAELKNILKDIEDGKVEFEIDAEDIHMNIEKILIERIGEQVKDITPAEAVTTKSLLTFVCILWTKLPILKKCLYTHLTYLLTLLQTTPKQLCRVTHTFKRHNLLPLHII